MLLMGRDTKVKLLRASIFTHATEDLVKVKHALLNIVPQELREAIIVAEDSVKGHHGNEIRINKFELHGDEALKVLKYIICSLSEGDKAVLLLSLNDRVGDVKSHLYIRLGKQEAYAGKLTIRDGSDVIKVSATVEGCRTLDAVKAFIDNLIKEC